MSEAKITLKKGLRLAKIAADTLAMKYEIARRRGLRSVTITIPFKVAKHLMNAWALDDVAYTLTSNPSAEKGYDYRDVTLSWSRTLDMD